jgi:peptidoglycan/xylan/chitin deacetylase (PgdA/CDA1 family)
VFNEAFMSNFFKFMIIWTILLGISIKIGNVFFICAVGILFFAVMFCGVKFLSLNFFGVSICKIKKPQKNAVFLSFDDGPNPNVTHRVLELLDKYNQKATFFCVVEKAKKHPETVKKIVENKHALASHDLSHDLKSNFRRTKQMVSQIGESVRILEEISQTKIKFYRPPVGLSNPHLFVALKKLDLRCVGWSKSACDGANRIVSAIKNIPNLSDAKDGDIILLHDDSPAKNETLFLQNLENLIIKFDKSGKKSFGIFT